MKHARFSRDWQHTARAFRDVKKAHKDLQQLRQIGVHFALASANYVTIIYFRAICLTWLGPGCDTWQTRGYKNNLEIDSQLFFFHSHLDLLLQFQFDKTKATFPRNCEPFQSQIMSNQKFLYQVVNEIWNEHLFWNKKLWLDIFIMWN